MDAATCIREVEIVVPVEAVRQKAESVTAEFQRAARIPGFRPGHAPKELVRRRYNEGIKGEVAQSLVPQYLDDEIKRQKLSVVGRPRIENLKYEDGEPLTFKATVEIIPEFELKIYKGLEVEEPEVAVTDEDVEQALRNMQEQAATFEVVEDRPSEAGDVLSVHYSGQNTQAPDDPPLTARDAEVRLDEKGTVPEFSNNLTGAKAGEVREFDVNYPENYPRKSLAGKSYHYRVEVATVRKKSVPALDDDLAKSASEFATLEALRAHLRERLLEQKKDDAGAQSRNKLIQGLVEAHDFPAPETLVEQQLDRRLERLLTQLLAQGVDPRHTEIDWKQVREEARPDAAKEVRASLILEKVADVEGIMVTEEEIDGIIRGVAARRGETPAALKTRLTREGELDRIKSSRRNEKTLDLIYQSARINRQAERK